MPILYPQVNIRSTEHYPWAIYRDATPRENSTMDKYERRRLAVAKLIEEKCDGKGASFAKAISRDASYVTRMLYPEGKAGRKRIGDDMIDAKTAREYAQVKRERNGGHGNPYRNAERDAEAEAMEAHHRRG